jgi:hypothetical protein
LGENIINQPNSSVENLTNTPDTNSNKQLNPLVDRIVNILSSGQSKALIYTFALLYLGVYQQIPPDATYSALRGNIPFTNYLNILSQEIKDDFDPSYRYLPLN